MAVRLAAAALLVAAAVAALFPEAPAWSLTKKGTVVSYDERSLMIDGKRDIFFSGAIHYPRSPPEAWPKLIKMAKKGGLNTIETYVFWNAHEPEPGKYNFEGRFDLVRFLKLVQEHDMYAIVRIGPFIQAEWNHGGLPFWLREVPNIIFRTNNEPFKQHMEKFVRFIVQKLKDADLYAPQGGPIILSQIENEYSHLIKGFKEEGQKYLDWAGQMAVSTGAGVPWVMCKQSEAPGEVIPSCNGRHCGDTWSMLDKNKPRLWTENWTTQYRIFGEPFSQRSAEDIAYSVLRFFAKGGSLVNYYMYYGGTNLGRTGASFVLTGYYDEGPIDEYGLYKEPKFGHLRDLHYVLRSCQKAFLWGKHSSEILGRGYEAHSYEWPEKNLCVSFLSNNNTGQDGTVTFRGETYFVPSRSVSLLAHCKNVVYNTKRVIAQHNERTFHTSDETGKNNVWEMFAEKIPKYRRTKIKTRQPMEQYNQTKDTSDYLWYSTSFRLESDDLPFRRDIRPVVQVQSHGHALLGFTNDVFVGHARGTKSDKGFVFEQPIDLKVGINHIAILSSSVGMMDSGHGLQITKAGVRDCRVQGLNTGTLDLQENGWGHQVGLEGEEKKIYTEKGTDSVQWNPVQSDRQITWYKRYFDTPDGGDPVALDMGTVSKGMIYVNGEGIGRYWTSFKTIAGHPSQSVYHIPRAFLKPKNNLLVIFEEESGKPDGILIQTVRRDDICTLISEHNPAQIRTWVTEGNELKLIAEDHSARGSLICPPKKTIQEVVFASFGNPTGICGKFTAGTCHTPQAKAIVEKECLGKKSCSLRVSHSVYGADINCPETTATLAVHVRCKKEKTSN